MSIETIAALPDLATPIHFASPDINDADVAAVETVLRSGWITTGEQCLRLEEELAACVGARWMLTVSSCTAALEIAGAYHSLGPGTRVGVPTWTFAASALATARLGAEVVLLDVEEDTLNLDQASLAAALEDGIDAVVAVHFGGVPVRREILDMAASAGVPVIEDAAHALGATDHRGPIGRTGTTCFSFYATKNMTSAEGGALATDNEELARFAQMYRLHGLSKDAWGRYRVGGATGYDLEAPGIKANLPDLLAALARSQLSRFGEMQANRRRCVERYRAALAGVRGLRFVPGQLAEEGADHLVVVVLPPDVDRSRLTARFTAAGIGTSVHFRPLHTFSWFRRTASIGPSGVGTADRLASRVLSLPLHAKLTEAEVDRVCDVLIDGLST